ncbi:MAG: hypothetical protein ABII82_07055, partial [Verrucomicrobiota bacterium]
MTSTRRLWIYGLLLLLSALGVGALAVGLLIREQERLQSREQTAYETRVGAVTDRARIIAENIELLVGDAQNALMTTLKEAPADEPRPFLTEWQTYNPLVRDVFRATSTGRPVWGAGGESLREWLQTTPWREPAAEPEAFVSADADEAVAPASSEVVAQAEPGVSQTVIFSQPQFENASNRAEVSQNVIQYQSARRSLEEVAKVKSAPAPAVAAKSSSLVGLLSSSLAGEPKRSAAPAAPAAPAVQADVPAFDTASAETASGGLAQEAETRGFAARLDESKQDPGQLADAFASTRERDLAAQASFAPPPPAAPDRAGWAWATAA